MSSVALGRSPEVRVPVTSVILDRMRLIAAAAVVVHATCILLSASAAYGQTAANVAVVINEQSPASVTIGEHYVQRRGIPPENVIKVALEPSEQMSRARYAAGLEAPIARALTRGNLQDRILYIVLTKGIPLRIAGTSGPKGTASSVDSELTLLYRRMTGKPVAPSGPVENPYYVGESAAAAAVPFSHKDHDIYLVTRLDAFTTDEAIALIDRGMATEAGGAVVFDQRVDARSVIADRWMSEAVEAIKAKAGETPVVLEGAADPTSAGQTLGYFSWGAADPALRESSVEFPFVAGSIAATLGGRDAGTFEPKPGAPEPISGRLVRAGASGVGGNVAEPYLQSSFRPQILFTSYLAGLPLAEAFYRALPHVGWQSVVIGDPLTRPFGRPASRADLDPPIDAATGAPAYFAARRLESLRIDFSGVPIEALQHVVASETHQARDDRRRAIESLTRATALAPDSSAIHLRLALLHEEAGNSALAIKGYRRVVELQPRSAVALNNLAYALATRAGDLDEALEVGRKAFALAPQDGTVVDTLGWIEHLRGNKDEAARLLRMAAQRVPNQPEVRLHAAFALAEIGAVPEAQKHLDAALKLDPSVSERDDVKKLIERLRQLPGISRPQSN